MLKKIYEELVVIRKELQGDNVACEEPVFKVDGEILLLNISKPLDYKVNLRTVETSALVKELEGREGVNAVSISPDERKNIYQYGPAKVLIVID